MHIEVIKLPRATSYRDAMQMQHERRNAVELGRAPHALYLLEHTPVITLGRKAHAGNLLRSREELAAMGIEVCETDRGGDVTYHGPGQMVAYPILNLNAWRCSISWYLRALEEVLIRQMALYGLRGERYEGLTGVWIGGAKIAAIGIGIHHWTTFHGVALNVAPDMNHFACIVPCGIADKPVTSLARLMPAPPAMSQVMDDFARTFIEHFQAEQAR